MSLRLYVNEHARLAVVAGLCVVAFTLAVYAFWPHPSVMRVTFLDVGQGDAVLVESPTGARMLYDAGPATHAILPALSRALGYWGGIDYMVASHPDADHIGGFVDAFSRYRPKLYLDGQTFTASPDFAAEERTLDALHVDRRTVGDGSRIDLGGGVVADVLSPKQDDAKASLSTNDSSVVLHVTYGSSSVLLSGDLETDGEKKLVSEYGDALASTVLKAGHHGSKSSTSDLLLSMVRPKYVAISAGAHNKYGHPHVAALERIRASGAEISMTKDNGDIVFTCDIHTCTRG